jgi:hypothetical protein
MAANRTRVDRRSRTLASLLELKAEAHTAQSKAPPWIGDACLLDSDNLGGMGGAICSPCDRENRTMASPPVWSAGDSVFAVQGDRPAGMRRDRRDDRFAVFAFELTNDG